MTAHPYGECPNCGEWLEADEVDIGVGVQHGPPYCPACGWSSPDGLRGIDEEEIDDEPPW